MDGEIVAFEGSETSFPSFSSAFGVATGPELRRKVPVTYYIFDVL